MWKFRKVPFLTLLLLIKFKIWFKSRAEWKENKPEGGGAAADEEAADEN